MVEGRRRQPERVFHVTQAVLPDMLEAGWGRIVNISSSSTHSGSPFQGAYVAAKTAVNGLTKTLALEYGPSGITANVVPPGSIDTPMLRKAEADGLLGGSVEDIASRIPGAPHRHSRGHRGHLRILGLRGGRLHHRTDRRRQRRAMHLSRTRCTTGTELFIDGKWAAARDDRHRRRLATQRDR